MSVQKSSLAIYGLIAQEERQEMLDRLENAFTILSDPVRRRQYNTSIGLSWHQLQMDRLPPTAAEKPLAEETNLWSKATSWLGHRRTPDETQPVAPEAPREFHSSDYSLSTGRYLKSVRKLKGLTLQEIADVTKISRRYLEALEAEQPGSGTVRKAARGSVRDLYAGCLCQESELESGDGDPGLPLDADPISLPCTRGNAPPTGRSSQRPLLASCEPTFNRPKISP